MSTLPISMRSIIGEHGDTEVPVWSLANIAGIRFVEYCWFVLGNVAISYRKTNF